MPNTFQGDNNSQPPSTSVSHTHSTFFKVTCLQCDRLYYYKWIYYTFSAESDTERIL